MITHALTWSRSCVGSKSPHSNSCAADRLWTYGDLACQYRHLEFASVIASNLEPDQIGGATKQLNLNSLVPILRVRRSLQETTGPSWYSRAIYTNVNFCFLISKLHANRHTHLLTLYSLLTRRRTESAIPCRSPWCRSLVSSGLSESW